MLLILVARVVFGVPCEVVAVGAGKGESEYCDALEIEPLVAILEGAML